jgi:hypothetical protein
MVATQCDQLFANWAATIGLAFARTRVRDNALHLLTRWQAAVGIATLAGVNKRLDTTLDRQFSGFLWVSLFGIRRRRAIVQIESQFLHLVVVPVFLVAGNAQVEIVADGTVKSRFDLRLAIVTSVHETVSSLVVQIVQHGHG